MRRPVTADRLERAPGGLEFVNTRHLAAPRGIDPLGDARLAQAWLDSASQRHRPAAVIATGSQPQAIVLAQPVLAAR